MEISGFRRNHLQPSSDHLFTSMRPSPSLERFPNLHLSLACPQRLSFFTFSKRRLLLFFRFPAASWRLPASWINQLTSPRCRRQASLNHLPLRRFSWLLQWICALRFGLPVDFRRAPSCRRSETPLVTPRTSHQWSPTAWFGQDANCIRLPF